MRLDEVRENHDRLRLHGPADVHQLSVADEVGDRRHGVRHRHVETRLSTRPIAPSSPCSPSEDDGTPEVGVEERRPGDEELSAERVHEAILARPDGAGRARGECDPLGADAAS